MVHGESLYLHGSAASRMLGKPETGIPACVAVTLVDGLVLSRSAFDHSMKLAATLAPESLKALTRTSSGVCKTMRTSTSSAYELLFPSVEIHEHVVKTYGVIEGGNQ